MGKIRVENLYKIFGNKPNKALGMLKDGHDKQSVLDKTGMTVGVDNASFTIEAGEIFVIMGLSGSGKSTIVRMLNRLIEPTSGRVLVDGQDVTAMDQDELVRFRLHNMSMVFQSFALMPHQTVLDNASFGLELAGVEKEKRYERAMQALEQVGLKGWEDQYPSQLSGGMQQRVGLARGLAVDPEILLMDEAFSALDPLIRTEMQDELLKLQEEDERTIVFISHDLDEALRIGDRIAIMEGGQVVQVGTPDEILQNPANDYVRAFFRGVDPTNVISAGDIVRDTHPTIVVKKEGSLRAAHEILSGSEREHGFVLDARHRFLGVVSSEGIRNALEADLPDKSLKQVFLSEASAVKADESMQEILPQLADGTWPIPVVNEDNVFKGVVSKNRFLRTLHRTEEAIHTEGDN
ncbi:glycine betaine transporter subunit; ATP-binding compoent of ABC superfamily [Pseudodesulfovibrio profundus]|uniref:Glycine betaine transporter subunit ATP-binding compoent of ABC superfamily n=1 Tax=Pseudodesulfovibrio profundus TaxID=57320 RepID=A0A2C8FA38_9BACT|nr:glycine betaine/L-proline ABC transporter ATP-binding protein ProV [Pseudodesulfovibrio profundus]MBC17548.1 proline/glycine betaine ABC transporter ATP-binding protein ProV [Desulfovibrio sp.]SOB58896.1 glycine betaine transporter subunit; ATP-binding compoent of ABC superfamily [Pseudodesulfovibrio profundus]|tara:strand:- start:4419 stop:5639 length:1221 start_codon:yes stop_codon:yes gene_type:complete